MTRWLRLLCLAAMTALWCSACGPAAPAGHRHQEARFSASADLSAASLDVAIVPKPPYKLAVEFPFELRVAQPEAATHAADAAEERSEKRLHFSVPTPGAAAAGGVEAKVVFGICRGDDSICERVEHPFSVAGS